MARVKSHIFSTMRGSVAGITYFANQFHQILARHRTSPVDPSTTRQGQVRQAFGAASILFEALTPVEQGRWNDYAQTLTFPNPLGPIQVPGRQVAVGNLGLREYLETLGEAFTATVDTSPTTTGFLTMSPLSIGGPTAPGTGFSVNIGNPNPEDINVVVEQSLIFNSTRNRFKGPFLSSSLQVEKVLTGVTGVLDITVGANDDIVFVRLRAISETGPVRTSRPVILRAVVSTNP